MLIIFIAIVAWLAALVLVAALAGAAARGDEALTAVLTADRRELAAAGIAFEADGEIFADRLGPANTTGRPREGTARRPMLLG
jgi:hypothetical protein